MIRDELSNGAASSVEEFDASFRQASRALGTYCQQIRVAGRNVDIRFAGTQLRAQLSSPFSHLQTHDSGAPQLTISVWESERSNAAAPPLPKAPEATAANPTHDHRLLFNGPSLRAVYYLGPRVLTACSPQTGRAWMWMESARRLPLGEEAAPYRLIWRWWGAEHGHTLVHAAAVATPHAGALLVGKGGSGKSTTSIACLAAGFDFAGDDYVMLDRSGEDVHSLYSTGKLDVSHAPRLTMEPPAATEERTPREAGRPTMTKGAFHLPGLFGGRVVDRLGIDAIIAPTLRLDNSVSAITPMAAAETLTALAVSSLIQLPGSKAADLEAMANLARRYPGFRLELGKDVGQIPSVIHSLLQELGSGN